MAVLLVNQSRPQEAVRTLQEMEPNLLGRIGQELYSTEGGAVRRQLVSSQSSPFQDVVMTLATTEDSADVRRLAGTVMLRWKYMQGEDEAHLARQTRRSPDPRVRDLACEIAEQRTRLATLAQTGQSENVEKALQELEAKELLLGHVTRDYKDHLRVRTANLDDLRAALPAEAVLIEFRQFQRVDFRTGASGEPRVAALLLAGFDEPVLADLGPLAEVHGIVEALLGQSSMQAGAAAATLYQRLFAPFESKLAAAKVVYLAPDGLLHLVPYSRLKLADGRYWEERQEVHLLGTGRDLLRPDPDKPTRGLLALGGIDFGAAAIAVESSFRPLKASGEEVIQLKELYLRYRKDEPAEAWLGAEAGEARLKALTSPPRVLHFATHGFSPPNDGRPPMLLSGVALAGANRAVSPARRQTAFSTAWKRRASISMTPSWWCCRPAIPPGAASTIRKASMAWCARSGPPAPATSWSRWGRCTTVRPATSWSPSIAFSYRKPGAASRPRRCAKPASPTSTTLIRHCATHGYGHLTSSSSRGARIYMAQLFTLTPAAELPMLILLWN